MCVDIMNGAFRQVQKKQAIPPLRSNISNLFSTSQPDSEKFFSTPTLSSEAKDLLRRENPHSTKNFYDVKTRSLDKRLMALDSHLRLGARISSFSLLLSDALARCFEDPSSVDARSTQEMFRFLDDCLGFCLREFALGSASTSLLRRSLVLENLSLPSVGGKQHFLNLPLAGDGLFQQQIQ